MENDLISKSALIEEFRARKMTDAVPNYDRASSEVKAAIGKYVELTRALVFVAPAVDAVEVVRCRDCEEYVPWLEGDYICGRIGSYFGNTNPNDFCSRGVRKMVAEVEEK